MHKICFLTLLFLCDTQTFAQNSAKGSIMRLVFWNVENLFDIYDDSTTNDDAFTPHGENHWTARRYRTKLNHLCKTLVAMGEKSDGSFEMPIIVGLAEIENDRVLRDLCLGTPLRRYGYKFVHYDSPDRRGIDNALLYRKAFYQPFFCQAISLSDSSAGFYTRDILLVEGVTRAGDTIIVLVNHFPSKRGGTTAEQWRMQSAQKLRYTMDTLSLLHPNAAIIVTGDFNASPDEESIRNGLMQGKEDFENLMEHIKTGRGSYQYQGYWSCIDQIIVSSNLIKSCIKSQLKITRKEGGIFDAPFLLIDDDKNLSKKVFRTYLAMKYLGGYSDHLPVYIELKRVD